MNELIEMEVAPPREVARVKAARQPREFAREGLKIQAWSIGARG
jgi:hypothetical protein